MEVFAWKQEDMGGVDPAVITHKLNVNPSFKPVKQKRRSFAPERKKEINEEVGKLLQAKPIREVEYPAWLANVVLVKKANGKWRLCIDFTDINRTCSKDSFPLPRIDLIATAGHELLSFMDAFSGYNQISMDPSDQEKTSFVIGKGTYCYRVMPFRLKNAGATYQRLVNRMFQKQIGTFMEVYRRHAGKIDKSRAPHNPFSRGVPGPEKLQYDAKPSQMRFWSLRREVLRFYSQQPRNRGEPR